MQIQSLRTARAPVLFSLFGKEHLCTASLLLLIGCSHPQSNIRLVSVVDKIVETNASLQDDERDGADRVWRDKVVTIAKSAIGKRRLEFNGKSSRKDCSGTVRAIFEMAGVSLKLATSTKRQTDSKTIFEYVQANGKITNDSPETGDLIFFDNTVDTNRDGKFNDKFTHVGIVTEILENGQIRYVHYAHGRVVESSMQEYLRRGKRRAKGSTGDELFAGFGKLAPS